MDRSKKALSIMQEAYLHSVTRAILEVFYFKYTKISDPLFGVRDQDLV